MLCTTEKLLSKFIPMLCHDSDGLIFQVMTFAITFMFILFSCIRISEFYIICTMNKLHCGWSSNWFVFANSLQGWDDPYVPRTHEGLLKWKYANMNSVDFTLKVLSEV